MLEDIAASPTTIIYSLLACKSRRQDGRVGTARESAPFIGGMILHDLYKGRALPPSMSRDWVFLIIALLLIVLLHVGAPDLLIILLFPGLILAAVSNKGCFASVVNMRPLIWLGEISYSLYLIHSLTQFLMTQLLAQSNFEDRSQLSA